MTISCPQLKKGAHIAADVIFHLITAQSNLLSYGLNSLEPLRKSINSKEIYEKQAKKYNIVTIQPK